MSRLLALAREHRLMSALVGGTLAADLLYYGLHNTAQSYRAYHVSCTQQGSTEMLEVAPQLRATLRTSGERLGLEPSLVQRLRLFVTRGMDPVHLGWLSWAGLSACLGLPEHFAYSAQDTEQRLSFYFDDRPLSLSTKKGRQLYSGCLLLSEDERGFVLARELAYLTSWAAHVPPLVGTLAACGFIGTLHWMEFGRGQQLTQSLMANKSSRQKLAMTGVARLLNLGIWCLMAYQWYAAYFKSLDARVDRKAAAAYPSGAVTFYDKQVRRNTLIRAMLGDSIGRKHFTIKGNEVSNWVLSDPFLPVNQRRSKLRYDFTIASRESAAAAAAAAD